MALGCLKGSEFVSFLFDGKDERGYGLKVNSLISVGRRWTWLRCHGLGFTVEHMLTIDW
jgi:hypothetical protein